MEHLIYCIGIIIIPPIFYLTFLVKNLLNSYQILPFFINFLLFFIFLMFFYFFYFIIFSFFFFFNVWRYSKFFKKLGHAIYFKKLSIYFSFWQYIIIYIYKYIYNILLYIYRYIYNILLYIYKTYFLKKIIINFIIIIFKKYVLYIFINMYNIIILFKKFFFNIKFIEILYVFLFKKRDLNNKYLDDPFIYRNKFLKIFTNMNYFINYIINANYYIKKKNKIILFFFFILNKWIKIALYKNFSINILINYIWYNKKFKYYIIFKTIIYYIKVLFLFFYLFLLNSIYNIINICIYIIFYFIKFFNKIIYNNIHIIKYVLLLLFIIYFYWIINYFLLLLYKHYILYLPLFNVKENIHFINFEWIDLRNYFNIVKLHNVFIDLNIHNNNLYNEIIKQLNLKLNNYNFKFSSNFNINLYSEENLYNSNLNKETIILNNIFEKWNKYHGSKFIKRWKKYKRMLNWSLRHMFKGKDWYKAIKKEKLKSSNLPIFNNGRYYENIKTEISNNMGFWENLHQVKKLPYNKDLKVQFQKTQAWYTYFKKRHTSRKKSRYLLSSYMKLKHIPFNNIYKEFDTFFLNKYKEKKIYSTFELYLRKIKKMEKMIIISKNILFNIKYFINNRTNDRIFFFKKYYNNFIDKQKDLVWKNKIPTLLVTEMRAQRMPPTIFIEDKNLNDFVSMSHTDEMHQYFYYRDLSKKGCLKNVLFKNRYIYKKYPYNINKKKMYYHYIIKNYFNLIDTGIKIPKKFYFFDRSKLRNFNKLSHRLLTKIDIVYGNQLLKYKYWDKVFYLNRLNEKNLDFWGFFDYLKVNKYRLLKNNNNIFNLYFIDHWKKDYYHMRVYLLRIISFLHYYTLYKKVIVTDNIPLVSLTKDGAHLTAPDGTQIGLETLNVLNSFKFLNNTETAEENVMDQTKEHDQINENLFYHFKLRWHFKELLNSNGIESFGNEKKFMYIINLFHKKFNKYFVEYNKINRYNNKYRYKIKSYKIKVLRKIKNLKKFFFFNTKRNKGLRFFDYLNTFSVQYHIKHLLWHSPYSFFLLKKNNILKNIKINEYIYYFSYNYKKEIYNINFYSYIFNLFLNIMEIREDWASYLTEEDKSLYFNINLLNSTFYYCYNYGNFYYYYLNDLEFFRIFISLLKNYYNNFLIKLTQYHYIWENNDYRMIYFFKRYFKQLYNSLYLKIRYFIYQIHETYVRYLKRKYFHFLRKRYWIKCRVDLIPFWFIFDYYIKCFIKYLFNKYFIKDHFIFWWLYYKFNFSFFFFFWLNVQKYKYIYIFYLNNTYFFLFMKKIIYYIIFFINEIFKLINYYTILLWYSNILINNYIYILFFEYNIHLLKFLYKIIFFNFYFYIKLNIISVLSWISDLKYILYFKSDIQDKFQFFIKFFQNIKNRFIYFKSNYYYFKKQKLIRKRKRHVPLISLLSTSLKRNWFSLKNRSSNFFVFHNIFLLNIKTIYLIKYDINLYNFFLIILNTFPFIKKKLLKFNIFIGFLYLFYILFFLLIFIINKKYFNMFFISYKYVKLNIDFEVKKKLNNNIFNNFTLNKKNLYIYKFFLFKVKLSKKLNIINIFYNKKYLWILKLLKIKNHLNFNSFDQFDKNKPIYKINLFFTSFINIDNLNKYIKNYTKYFVIKKMPLINILTDYLYFYKFYYKKENILFNYKKITDNISFNYAIFYWIILIPYFCFQYILIKYHLKLYIKTKRRILYFFRIFLDNIKIFVKINKYIGRSFFKNVYKSKRWKDPSHSFLGKKRPKRSHFSLNNIRYRKLYYRLSPIGPYYYWFSKINVIKYMYSFKYFFFKTSIKSYYYSWFVILYFIFLIYWINKFINSINLNKLYFLKKV